MVTHVPQTSAPQSYLEVPLAQTCIHMGESTLKIHIYIYTYTYIYIHIIHIIYIYVRYTYIYLSIFLFIHFYYLFIYIWVTYLCMCMFCFILTLFMHGICSQYPVPGDGADRISADPCALQSQVRLP